MRRRGLLLFTLVLSCATAAAPPGGPAPPPAPERLLVCGGSEIYALELGGGGEAREVWRWRFRDRPELASWEVFSGSFDECKPVAGGRLAMTFSNRGGVILVDTASGRPLFWAAAVNAHSVDLLPRDRLVVAASVGEGGDRLVLFDAVGPAEPLWSDELPSAHGVVWDRARQRLWALGYAELRAYALRDWDGPRPRLERVATHPLPDGNGHDLSAWPGRPALVVTTENGVFVFDRDAGTFQPFPDQELARSAHVKGVSISPITGRIAFVRAETRWWAENVRLLGPGAEIHRPGERLYKARWDVPAADP